MTESQYQKACDQQAWEEDFLASRMERYADQGYSEEDCERMAEEDLKESVERSYDY